MKAEKSHCWDLVKDDIFKLLRRPGIDSKDAIPPAYA